MVLAIVLVVVTLAARLGGWLGWSCTSGWTAATAVGLAAMSVLTGGAHFIRPRRDGLIAVVPPRLPAPADAAASCYSSLAPPWWPSAACSSQAYWNAVSRQRS